MLASLSASGQAPAAPAPPPGSPADELPLNVAVEWAQAAIAACKANGYNVTVTYMNNEYGIKLVMRSDGARSGTAEIGRRKVFTVIKSGMSTADFAKSVGIDPSLPPVPAAPGKAFGLPPGDNPDPNTTVLAGGLQIKVRDKVVGAISVSGAPGGEKDVACAEAGLAKIANKLK